MASTITLTVEGMMCQKSCGTTVENALSIVPGVVSAKASFKNSNAIIKGTASVKELIDAIDCVGFDAYISNTNTKQNCNNNNNNKRNKTIEITAPEDVREPTNNTNNNNNKNNNNTKKLPHSYFDVRGMSCSSCSSNITRELQKTNGIQQVNVALLAGKMETIYHPTIITTDDIVNIVNNLGFECTFLYIESNDDDDGDNDGNSNNNKSSSTSYDFEITGMSCASCSNKIEKELNKMNGVVKASVNLMTKRMKIKVKKGYGPGVRDIMKTVTNIGFGITLSTSNSLDYNKLKESNDQDLNDWKCLFFSSLIFAVPIMIINMIIPMISVGLKNAMEEHIIPRVTYKTLLLFILSTPVQFWIGYRFHRAALKGLKHCNLGMDFLVSLGTTASYFYSVMSVLLACMYKEFHGQHFFESSALLLTFVVMGKLMESYAKGKTSDALAKLLKLQPKTALIIEGCTIVDGNNNGGGGDDDDDDAITISSNTNNKLISDGSNNINIIAASSNNNVTIKGGQEKMIDITLLQCKDIAKVLPGSTIPADGIVVKGKSTVDESMMSGEAMPVRKDIGMNVYGSTINHAGTIYVRITRVGKDTALAQIVRVVEEAQTSKAPIEKIADKISGIFAPVVLTLSILTFFGWFIALSTGIAPQSWVLQQTGMSNSNNFVFSFLFAIAVLVIACPCALGLATPTAVMVGSGVGAANGILIKGGHALEMAHKITTVVFDKTGTITKGKLNVVEVSCLLPFNLPKCSHDRDKTEETNVFLALIASAELGSEHPLATAIVKYVKTKLSNEKQQRDDRQININEPSSIDIEPGLGLKATVTVPDGKHSCTVCIGNRAWMNTLGIDINEEFEHEMKRCENLGCTAIIIAVDGNLVGVIGLLDTLKEDAEKSINALWRMGIDVHMITGDNKRTASIVAEKIGIPLENVQAEVLPENKSNAVKRLQEEEGKIVAMVGDGINDSPALAQSDIGIAVGQGSEIAIEAADVVLVKGSLEGVVVAIHLSRHVFKRILLNFIWALGYNMLGIPLAAGVFYPFFHIGLPPQFAGLAMAFSSVSVVCSSLHLKYYVKPDIDQLLVNSNGNNSRNINDDGCFKRLFDRLTKRGYQTLATFDDEGIYDDDDLVRMVEEEEDGAFMKAHLYGEDDGSSGPDMDGFDGLELV